jgi:hypothetical protein
MDVLLEDIQDESGHDGGAHDHRGGDGDSYQACILLCKKYHTTYNPLHLIQAQMRLDPRHDDDDSLVQIQLQSQTLRLAFYICRVHNLVVALHQPVQLFVRQMFLALLGDHLSILLLQIEYLDISQHIYL